MAWWYGGWCSNAMFPGVWVACDECVWWGHKNVFLWLMAWWLVLKRDVSWWVGGLRCVGGHKNSRGMCSNAMFPGEWVACDE